MQLTLKTFLINLRSSDNNGSLINNRNCDTSSLHFVDHDVTVVLRCRAPNAASACITGSHIHPNRLSCLIDSMTTQFISRVERELYPTAKDGPGPGNYSSAPTTPMLPNFYSFGGASSSSPKEVRHNSFRASHILNLFSHVVIYLLHPQLMILPDHSWESRILQIFARRLNDFKIINRHHSLLVPENTRHFQFSQRQRRLHLIERSH